MFAENGREAVIMRDILVSFGAAPEKVILEDRSLKDIAQELGITVGAVKTHSSRGRSALRRWVRHRGPSRRRRAPRPRRRRAPKATATRCTGSGRRCAPRAMA